MSPANQPNRPISALPLLTESERRLLDRLSVFAGAFTLDAAESVTAGDGIAADDVFDLLASLVARYLVVAGAEAGETRYRLLETIRQYAQEHLDETEDTKQQIERLKTELPKN